MISPVQYTDAPVSLTHRQDLERLLRRLLDESRSEHRSHGLLYLDLDRFKIINASCGQVAGDELLRQLAAVLADQLRTSDRLIRLGGDEFAVLLPHCGPQHAVKIGELLLQAISDFRFVWDGRDYPVSAGLGLVCVEDAAEDAATWLRRAEIASCTAKELGRNRLHVFSAQDREPDKGAELAWAGDVRLVMDENRIQLHVQHILPLQEEASAAPMRALLARLVGQDGRVIPPAAFLKAAQRHRMMTSVDRWVIRQALEGLAAEGGDTGILCIKLSAAACRDGTLYDDLVRWLAQTGVPATRLCFELSESAALEQLPAVLELIRALRNLGAHFTLNKFATGLQAFSYLKTLSVDFVKIDGALVRGIVSDRMDRAIVEAVHKVARAGGIRTIAEQVETAETRDLLKQLGLDYAQGGYLHHAEPWPP